MTDWIALAQAELTRIPGPHINKKHATIIALVESRLSPEMTEEEVWQRKDTCARTTYHTKWKKQAIFSEVLTAVTKIATDWQSGTALRHLQERRDAWQEEAHNMASKMLEKAMLMIDFPIQRTVIEDDNVIIEPVRWSMDTVPRLATAADKMARLALDMDTDTTPANSTQLIQIYLPDNGRDAVTGGDNAN